MVNYYIYAKDFSGSTSGVQYYHQNGMKSLEQFHNDVENIEKELAVEGKPPIKSEIIYLHWGDDCFQISKDETVASYLGLLGGNMYTEPETIVAWLKQNCDIHNENNRIKLLYIITDGMIENSSVSKCYQLNENMNYEKVVFHAFNRCLNEINLSVAASFFKSRCMSYRNYELFDNVDISEEFDYNKINLQNFETERDNLKSYIKLKFIAKIKHNVLALKEIDKLKELRRRLFADMDSQIVKPKVNLETRDKNAFLQEFVHTQWYKELQGMTHDTKVVIEKSISTLINYITTDNKSFSFDALKFDTKFDKPAEEETIVDVNFEPEQEIEFPDIILDDEKGIPVILLMEFNLLDKIIFHKTKDSDEVSPASFNKFKSTMECPLFLLDDSDISESIGYFYTLNAYKQLLANSVRTEPRTRRPFHGGLVLTDTDEFDKYNDYILSSTYFNFRKVKYNIGLFYYVLWKNCENKEWMDKNVVERFKTYVMRRISTTKCRIALSSLPLDPPEITTLPTALWYCVELSSCLFKNDSQNFTQERLRMYYGVAHCMIEILQYFNYDLDLASIETRRDLIRYVMILKKIPTRGEKLYFLLEKIFKNVNGLLVSEIEKPFNLNKLNYLKLNHKNMLREDVIEETVHLNDYVHLMHFVDRKGSIAICEKTYRPFFAIDQNNSFYTELVKITKKVVINNDDDKDNIKISYEDIDFFGFDRLISLFNLFIKCVQKTTKYPSLPEYIEYVSKKNKFYGDLVKIVQPNIFTQAENVYSSYQHIMSNVDVNTFVKVTKSYVKRTERIKAEEVFKFKHENEIDEFISSQESKSGLKKQYTS